MGNAAFCAPSVSTNGAVKVLCLDGRLQVFTRPLKAAELMQENAGLFVCESSNLKVGYRMEGLTADEVLEMRQLYFLIPVDLLYSVLTHEELIFLNYRASRAVKHGSLHNLGKIFPVFSEFCLFPNSELKKLDFQTTQGFSSKAQTAERYSKQRLWSLHWRPLMSVLAGNGEPHP